MNTNDPRFLLHLAKNLNRTLCPWEPTQDYSTGSSGWVRGSALHPGTLPVKLMYHQPFRGFPGDRCWVLYVNDQEVQRVEQPKSMAEEAKLGADNWLKLDGWLFDE